MLLVVFVDDWLNWKSHKIIRIFLELYFYPILLKNLPEIVT